MINIFRIAFPLTIARPTESLTVNLSKALAVLLVCLPVSQSAAQVTATPLADMVLDANALVMPTGGNFIRILNGGAYQQEGLITFGGYQFAAWYQNGVADEDIFLARRLIGGTTWEVIDTGLGLENGDDTASAPSRRWDSHNVIGLGVSGDGRIHLSFDQHVDVLRYVTTAPGFATSSSSVWNQAAFTPERDSLNENGPQIPRVTYPRFTNMGDDLVFTYRDRSSSNGDHYVAVYNSQTGLWNNTNQFTDGRVGTYNHIDGNPSTRRNAYLNGFDVDLLGRMHATWTYRENSSDANHDIHYAFSDDNGQTWNNNAGANLGGIITLDSPGAVVVDLNSRQALLNQQGQVVDGEGGVHVLMRHRRQEPGFEWEPGDGTFDGNDAAYHHHYRDPVTGVWDFKRLPVDRSVGSRPKIGVDPNGSLVGIYISGNDLVIAGSQKTASGFSDWEILFIENAQNYEGNPLLDPIRLEEEGILSVFVQERAPTSSETIPTGSPLHVLEYAITSPEPPEQPSTFGTLIAGWDTWDSSGVKSPDVTDGITTGTTTSSSFSLDSDRRARTDGTWGTLDDPAADTTADDSGDSARLVNGSSGFYEFTVTDSGGVDRDLTTFHFDAGTLRPNSARNYELSIVAGDLTTGPVVTGIVPSVAGGQQDWFDFDISLADLTDHTLDANGTVTFRLEFTGGVDGAGGHHQSLDNVAITAEAPSNLIAGWDTWDRVSVNTWDATEAMGVTALANGTPELGGSWFNFENAAVENGASSDGLYGGSEFVANASVGSATDGLSLANGFDGHIDFTLTDTTGADRTLSGFHFDIGAFRVNAATDWELEVLPGGDLTDGLLAVGTATVNAGPMQDDESIDLTGIADNVLDAFGSVTFRMTFTGGGGDVGSAAGGHHLFLDNVGVSAITRLNDVLLGDANLDGEVNFLDISSFITLLQTETYLAQADANQDGELNFLDISPFITLLANGG